MSVHVLPRTIVCVNISRYFKSSFTLQSVPTSTPVRNPDMECGFTNLATQNELVAPSATTLELIRVMRRYLLNPTVIKHCHVPVANLAVTLTYSYLVQKTTLTSPNATYTTSKQPHSSHSHANHNAIKYNQGARPVQNQKEFIQKEGRAHIVFASYPPVHSPGVCPITLVDQQTQEPRD